MPPLSMCFLSVQCNGLGMSGGAWAVGRVVRKEWKGLFRAEPENLFAVQWLRGSGWERWACPAPARLSCFCSTAALCA